MEGAISQRSTFYLYNQASGKKISLCLLIITLVHFSNVETALSKLTSGLLAAKFKAHWHLIHLCHLYRLTTPSFLTRFPSDCCSTPYLFSSLLCCLSCFLFP